MSAQNEPENPTTPSPPKHPFFGLDDDVKTPTALACALQHVLAMFVGIVTPPLVVASALKFSIEQTAFLISMALFTSGLATFIQVRRFGKIGSGMLSVQGTSFTFVPLAIQSGQAGGLPLIFGMAIAASPVEMILSRFLGTVKKLFPPVVTGCVVMLIGMSLIKVGMTDLAGGFHAPDFGSPKNLALGFFVMGSIILLNRFGQGYWRTLSIALGMVLGYAIAALFGMVDFSQLGKASWFTGPQPLKFGLDFQLIYLLPWVIGYLVTSIESIGDLTATSEVSKQPVQGDTFMQRLRGGILADGVGSLVGGLFNAMPNTTFSQNNGVISLTGVASRKVGLFVAGLLMLLGLFPKLGALLSVMPKPVLGGATLVLFAMVAVAGLRIVAKGGFSARNQFIMAITLGLGMGVSMVPDAISKLHVIHIEFAKWVHGTSFAFAAPIVKTIVNSMRIILKEGLAVGAITAISLHLFLPKDEEEPVVPLAQKNI